MVIAAAFGAEGSATVLGILALDTARLPTATADGDGLKVGTAEVVAIRSAADNVARPPVRATSGTAPAIRTACLAYRARHISAEDRRYLVGVLGGVFLRLLEALLFRFARLLLALGLQIMGHGIVSSSQEEIKATCQQTPQGMAA